MCDVVGGQSVPKLMVSIIGLIVKPNIVTQWKCREIAGSFMG